MGNRRNSQRSQRFSAVIYMVSLGAACSIVTAISSASPPQAATETSNQNPGAAHCLTEISTEPKASGYERTTQIYHVPDISLIAMDGTDILATHVLDHPGPVMLNFIFTTCKTICPVLSATFSQVRTLLKTEAESIRFVSITIDPEQDTPSVLSKYAQKYHTGTGWEFFTGRAEDIVTLQRAFDIYRGNKMSHRPVTFLRTDADAPWLRLEGFPTAKDLAREYRTLLRPPSLAESSD